MGLERIGAKTFEGFVCEIVCPLSNLWVGAMLAELSQSTRHTPCTLLGQGFLTVPQDPLVTA